MNSKKIVKSPEQIIREARERAKGGPKPEWMGKTVHIGDKAVVDWDEYESRSIEVGELASFGKLIGDNQDLLQAIEREHPQSIADLSKSIGRADGNVSRSLAKLEKMGLVKLIPIEGTNAKRPELAVRKMRVEVDVIDMTVSVRTPKLAPA